MKSKWLRNLECNLYQNFLLFCKKIVNYNNGFHIINIEIKQHYKTCKNLSIGLNSENEFCALTRMEYKKKHSVTTSHDQTEQLARNKRALHVW